ncbi:carboxypeptidase-like regulatory domain-containing protein [Aquihabitans sp. G128]|uniref:carboxypeptidase-like regulatory domain-containing protein n=1 Tax=Aquihabitans sp. G128 TaxID=2849779 RepID=UPI001C235896|nr:carboxypeptidase-like regulatory domain-containing protein [Aquihabitans sp. G128]QXC60055.1 carboxypeptidase-like regulatory domain-containing protein [Aquihabitans sp. G128]
MAAAAVPQTVTVTVTFGYTGAAQEWVVPAGVTSATFELSGGHGQNTLTSGGNGGYARAVLPTTPSATVQVNVAGGGGNTFNGGGVANNCSGGNGGGASDVRIGGVALTDRVLVAGGGGGGTNSDSTGGAGGGTSGTSGSGIYGGGGGTQTEGGRTVFDYFPAATFGSGATLPIGYCGGAGGGGWYGGGSGLGTLGAGGGGSGHGPEGAVLTAGESVSSDSNGLVTITYEAPAPASCATCISGVAKDAVTGAPVAGVRVRALQGTVSKATVYTAADGSFTLPNLVAGQSYRVQFNDVNNVPARYPLVEYSPNASGVGASVTPGGALLDEQLTPYGAISGIVVNKANGQPLANVRVRALVGTTEKRTVTTGADGTFVLPQLLAGNYSVQAADAIGGNRAFQPQWYQGAFKAANATPVASGSTISFEISGYVTG